MNDLKCTPGPWLAENGRVNAGKECVLVSHSFDYEGKRAAEERANLQVAAAAPDLYAALKPIETLAILDRDLFRGRSPISFRLELSVDAVAGILAALAKARGEV